MKAKIIYTGEMPPKHYMGVYVLAGEQKTYVGMSNRCVWSRIRHERHKYGQIAGQIRRIVIVAGISEFAAFRTFQSWNPAISWNENVGDARLPENQTPIQYAGKQRLLEESLKYAPELKEYLIRWSDEEMGDGHSSQNP